MMPYICAECLLNWPCPVERHRTLGTTKVWMLEQSAWSIACYMFEHELCDGQLGCPCSCHVKDGEMESAIGLPPSNR